MAGQGSNEAVGPGGRRERARRARRGGVTLVELLLVVAVIGIVTAVVLPSFVRSIRGNRLRTAALSVVTAGRYARSLAVMRQTPVEARFESDRILVEDVVSRLDGVRIETPLTVAYRVDGRCTPYRIALVDDEERRMAIDVDEIASARTYGEWKAELWR